MTSGTNRFEFQELAYSKFAKLRVGALFMKMGSGKTKVAVDLINNNASKIDRVLWVTPNQVKEATKLELKKWGPRCKFRVIAYESLSQSKRVFNDAMDYVKAGKCFLVLDESIFIKNGESLRWQRCKAIRILCPYCIILNGTPVQRDEWDLYWQMNMLDERIIPYAPEDFGRLFFDRTIIHQRGRPSFTKYRLSQQNAGALAKYIQPYTFQVDIDYGIASEDTKVVVPCTVSTANDYKAAKNDALDALRTSVEAFMGKLGELCQIAAIDANRVAETAKRAKDRPVIIYAKYRLEVWLIKKALKDKCYCIDGGTKRDERHHQLELFEIMKDRPLILSFGTGSYGLNLQFANEVIFNSYDWNYGTLEQAKARVMRIGQQREVHYTFIESDLKIQKLLRTCIENKTDMAGYVKQELMNGRAIEL